MLDEIVAAHKRVTTPESAEMTLAEKLQNGMTRVSACIDKQISNASNTGVKLKTGGTAHFGLPCKSLLITFITYHR
jgi:hypothetical protein